MRGVSYQEEDWGGCGGAIGHAEGIEDAGRGCDESRGCRYRCADGRKYPWEQHGDSGVGEAASLLSCDFSKGARMAQARSASSPQSKEPQ
jgi:hypothetical protein